jgi:hypothetical protein
LLLAIGVPPEAANLIVNMRNIAPIKSMDQINKLIGGPAASRLTNDSSNFGSFWTLRSTGRLRYADGTFSEVKRTVSAQVKFFRVGHNPLERILRWYDESPAAPAARPMVVDTGFNPVVPLP